MSKKSWEDYTVAEVWEGYKNYGVWSKDGLIDVRDDAPEWLKKCWEFDEQQRKDGIKV